MKDAEGTWDVWAKAKEVKVWLCLRSGLTKVEATREMNDRRGRLSGTKWSDTVIIIRRTGDEPPS